MNNPYNVPELTVEQLAQRLEQGEALVLLDVREPVEMQMAQLDEEVEVAPVSALVREGEEALPEVARDRDARIVVYCHHGMRSAQVVAWLRQQGWNNVWNLAGGIDAYARRVDSTVGFF